MPAVDYRKPFTYRGLDRGAEVEGLVRDSTTTRKRAHSGIVRIVFDTGAAGHEHIAVAALQTRDFESRFSTLAHKRRSGP